MAIFWIVIILCPVLIGCFWFYKRDLDLKRAGQDIEITFPKFLMKKWWLWVGIIIIITSNSINAKDSGSIILVNFLLALPLASLAMWAWWLIVRRVVIRKK